MWNKPPEFPLTRASSWLVCWSCLALLLLAGSVKLAAESDNPPPPAVSAAAPSRNVTFLVTSDVHYDAFENEDRNDRVRDTLRAMNTVTNLTWPEELGGGPVERPHGLMVLGDVIDDGDRIFQGKHQTPRQFWQFQADFGLDGTDGLLDFPVYETWGNHDGTPVGREKNGFSFQAQLKQRNQLRQHKGWLANLSTNGLFYSWDWEGVHFVMLGIYAADTANQKWQKYSPTWHDPQGSLTFLREDLAKHVGTSGRPVVVMTHCGFDTDWWHTNEWRTAYEVLQPYRLLAWFYGHTGTGLKKWSPARDLAPFDCVNTGQTEKGFFVVQIVGERLRLAYRIKRGTEEKLPDGKRRFKWDGTWEWKFPFQKPLTVAAVPPPAASPNSEAIQPIMLWADRTRAGKPFSKDPCVIKFGGRYLMYCSLAPSTNTALPKGWAIGIVESRDLVNWRKVGELLPGQECDRNGLCAPGALVLDGKVHLFYQTYGNGPRDAICHAVSADGLQFVRDASNPIFRPAGGWNAGRAIDAEVFPVGDRLLLYFATRDPEMKVQMLGVAGADLKSDFGRGAWKQLCDAPILKPELPWEKRCIEAPSLCRRGDTLFMFYAGGYNNEPQQIGVATSKDGLAWTRLSDVPFLAHGGPGDWNASESGHPGLFTDDDGRTVLFFQGNNDQGKTWFLSSVEVTWVDQKPVLKRS